MESSKSSDELFRHDKYHPCFNTKHKSDTGFKSVYLQKGDVLSDIQIPCNNILMVISGEIEVCCGMFRNRVITGGNMVLIPRGSSLDVVVYYNTEIMIFGFNTLLNLCDRMRKERLQDYCEKIHYDFCPTPIRAQLHAFIGLMKCYLDHDINCAHLFECKHYEFFICLNAFYLKDEITSLLYPILGKVASLRTLVIDNTDRTTTVSEMIALSGMGKTQFYEMFKKEFGMTAKQWMLKHKVDLLHSAVVDPTLSVKEIMHLCGFDNPTLFHRFCCRHFGKSPEKTIGSLRDEIQLISISHSAEER